MGDKPIIKYSDCKVVSFKKYTHEIDGKIVYEIVATDISERYRKSTTDLSYMGKMLLNLQKKKSI